ncbi:redox-regulated ATPase YchF [Nitrososphaera viennensis]|uniref:Redox-regulated ATPase YchF n=2 Tax=Nitrososphaera viennensis TaxID=1034015 RepID=A0A977IFI0_9ARCH|nr:redox-regulated ATPase YchF [Nitrososphaera viennensis]AIC14820.1 putative GTP binding protein [Nitrososphaera viennensis EN76]UVS69773.1 redox-regulated ATPase YchF [Nitrososphaera viennensis]
MIKIGLIGKTNTGKTTFFNSATLASAEISNYPFTTKQANIGNAHAITVCVHKEFGVQDNPKNSRCIDGWRFIPVELVDLPGLIKGAWEGKGLGNQFLSIAAQSDALLHIVDASGSIDASGKIAEPGSGDPVADVGDIEEELVMWYLKLFEANRDKISRNIDSGIEPVSAITEVFRGIGVREDHVRMALAQNNLASMPLDDFGPQQSKDFCWSLRDISKPTLIVANKVDLPTATDNFRRLREEYKDMIVVPSSADAELTLRRAESRGLIRYIPGDERFEINEQTPLNDKQKWALNFIRKDILGEYMRTGVQFAINVAVFKLLKMNAVYPVADAKKMSDKHGNVLPDVYLMRSGSTVEDLAREIHSELAKGLLYALDARDGLHLPANYHLKDRDVLSIVSAKKKK